MTMLYCRWQGCGHSFISVGGIVPVVCEKCGREGRWSTVADSPIEVAEPTVVQATDDPAKPWELHDGDIRLLHALRIDPYQ